MADDPQPELRWAPLEPAPKRAGRVWLIIGLAVAVLAIVGTLVFVFLPRGDSPVPGASASPSPSMSPSASSTATPSAEPEPTETPIVTPPPAGDPTVEVFREKVSGWLNSAPRGLDIVMNNPGPDALPVVDSLEQDAQRLSDSPPPSSIAQEWRDGVSAYAQRLVELRSALTEESGVAAAVETARTAAQELRTLVGL